MSILNLLPIIITLFGAYLLIKLRFFFVLHPIYTAKRLCGIMKDKSSRKSLALALAGTLGVGNIVGVAYGISVGGAGCIFWILVSSIFASCIKYAESLISADSRNGGHGGMMYVITASFGKVGRVFGSVYAVLCVMLSLSMGSALQAQSALESAEKSMKISPAIFSLFFVVFVGIVIIGGAKKIENATAIIIPLATIIYILICIAVILLNFEKIPSVICEIVKGAFSIKSAAGGISAFLFSNAVKEGYARGLLSNEAGAGTSAMAQTRSQSITPVQTGLLGMCEVLFDTVILCTLTGVTVLVSDVDFSSVSSGMTIVLNSVSSALGKPAQMFIFLLVTAFAYSTVVCWYYYGCECLNFLFGKEKSKIYATLFILITFFGAFIPSGTIIIFTDYVLFFMSVLTIIVLLKNSERIFRLSEQYGLLKKSKHSDVRKKGVTRRSNL